MTDIKRIEPIGVNCCGCSACYSVCPQKCIIMIEDSEGFQIPKINFAECINCGMCKNVCPMSYTNKPVNLEKKTAYAAISKNIDVWRNSTSGGAFSELCNIFFDKYSDNAVFVGACFQGLKVVHTSTNDINYIGRFRKSKYIQSDMRQIYADCKRNLQNNKFVLFSGTPCQVSALRNYLGKPYDNLLCIDLICHGVGSPAVFRRFIEEESKKQNKMIKEYEFRVKTNSGDLYQSKTVYCDGTVKIENKDAYVKLFLQQLCIRSSCAENCKWKNDIRAGDITIADFKMMHVVFPKNHDWKNYSCIIFNTEKGLKFEKEIIKKMTCHLCSIEDVKSTNPLYYRSLPPNVERDRFFREFAKGKSITELSQLFCKEEKKSFFKKIIHSFPARYRYRLARLLKIK